MDRLDARAALDRLISPKSVCIVGASDSDRMSGRSLRHLLAHGYPGEIHLVNPKHRELAGRACHARVSDLPAVPDTAIIVSPAPTVLALLRECAAAGIRTATVVAAGLTEGAAGEDRDDFTAALAQTLRDTGMRILGPNTPGLVNLSDGYAPRAASLGPPETMVRGDVGIVTQSGALGLTVLNKAVLHGVGVSAVVHTGNQFDLDVWDVADYYVHSDRVRTIAMVIEGFKDADKFRGVARAARAAGKPIMLFKVGTSAAGASVVTTHSGALAGEATVQRAVLAVENVVQVDDLDQMWEVLQLFQRWGVPTEPVRTVAVAALSGGEAAIAADAAEHEGFRLPQLSAATVARLEPLFSFAEFRNPFDITAQFTSNPSLIDSALSALSEDGQYDALVVTLSNMPPNQATDLIEQWLIRDRPRPHVALGSRIVSGYALPTDLAYAGRRVPILEGVERLMPAIRLYNGYAGDLEDRLTPAAAQRGRALAPAASTTGRPEAPENRPRILSYWESRTMLSKVGLRFNAAEVTATGDAAVGAARSMSLPVTIKASRGDIVHKADMGAVHGLVAAEQDVHRLASDMLKVWWSEAPPDLTAGDGVIVEQYVASRIAAFVGARRDAEFGPVLLFGLGGGYAEYYADVLTLPWPDAAGRLRQVLDHSTVGRMLARLSGSAVDDVAGQLELLGDWFARSTEVESVDLNPFLIGDSGVGCFVDARVALW